MANIKGFCIPAPNPRFDPPLKLFGNGRSAFGHDFDLTAKSWIAQLVSASAAIAYGVFAYMIQHVILYRFISS
jgi:hypothetical protein